MIQTTHSNIAPLVSKFVDKLISKSDKIGTCAGVIRIAELNSGSGNDATHDRFKIVLPYGGQFIKWEILFNSCYPEDPPDLIFLSDDHDFIPDIDNLKNFCNWNYKDEDSLLLTIQDLMHEFKRYHLRLLSGSRLEYDYNSLVQDESLFCSPDDIEVHVSRRNGYVTGPVQFMIKLKIDFDRIPEYLTKGNPGEDKALVVVNYQTLDGGKVTTQICLSPRIERIFGAVGGLRPIPFPHEGCLIDYIPTVTEQIQKMIHTIGQSFEKRKEYVTTFIGMFGSNVLEYDAVGFTKMNFIIEQDEFQFLLSIELTQTFPAEQPTFCFLSIYQMKNENSGIFASKIFKTYPYSPRWSCQEMAERAKIFLADQAINFQKEYNQETIF